MLHESTSTVVGGTVSTDTLLGKQLKYTQTNEKCGWTIQMVAVL